MNYLFDVDGTLTPNRQAMVPEFEPMFFDFCKHRNVYLVSGSDYSKLQEQLPDYVLHECKAVFASSANEEYINGKLIRANEWQVPKELIRELELVLFSSQWSNRVGNHIEIRNGMINFSILGRNYTDLQREEYVRWETVFRERQRFISALLQPQFPDLCFKLGGEISIDIYPKGAGKEQCLKHIPTPITFFGDRINEGGNDRDVALELLKTSGSAVFHVTSWEDTYRFIRDNATN